MPLTPVNSVPASPVTQKIDAVVQAYGKKGEFDGVALAARGGTTLYRGAVGLAHRARNVPHRPDAPFPICSITKQFTALLVMQEVAAGKLSLDGTLSDYQPAFRKDTARQITLRQMLMHTSGLPNSDDVPDLYTGNDARFTDASYVAKTFLQKDLLYAPGSKFRYNNADYLVLSEILAHVNGKPYARLLSERILKPLGMTRSGLITANGVHPDVVGYERDTKTGSWHPSTDGYRLENYGAAGAMYSTVDDLQRWDNALLTDRLLPRRFRDIMFTSDPAKGYVALGSWSYKYLPFGGKVPTLIERQGGIGAYHAQNLLAPEDGVQVILFSNLDTADLAAYSGKGIACDILQAIYDNPA